MLRASRDAMKKKVQEARRSSGKEPFDFTKLRRLYESMAVLPRTTLEDIEAESLEESYYMYWDDVTTLRQAAERIRRNVFDGNM